MRLGGCKSKICAAVPSEAEGFDGRIIEGKMRRPATGGFLYANNGGGSEDKQEDSCGGTEPGR